MSQEIAARATLREAHRLVVKLGTAVVTNEDVVRQKPAPDIFLEAAGRIGVAPERCRAFEDTDLGMQAIRSAGMDAVEDVLVIHWVRDSRAKRPQMP